VVQISLAFQLKRFCTTEEKERKQRYTEEKIKMALKQMKSGYFFLLFLCDLVFLGGAKKSLIFSFYD
jgi:hypothetical protein